jgi:hypothetical protein
LNDADVIISAFGRNDATNAYNSNAATQLANFQAAMQGWWAQLPPGKRIYQTTISPETNSANNASYGGTPSIAGMKAINDWLRTIPAPLAGIIDFADMTMTSRNSGLWASFGGTCYSDTESGIVKIHPSASTGIPALQASAETALGAIFGTSKESVTELDMSVAVTLAANTSYVSESINIPIPAGILRGIVVQATIPGGNAGGSKAISYSVGSLPCAVNEQALTTATDFDVMAVTSATTAASSNATLQAAWLNQYLSTPTNVWLNFIGAQGASGASAGTCGAQIKVWVFVDRLQ